MEFLSEIIAKEVQTLAHATGQRYLKIDDQGKVFGTTNVEETDPTVPAYVKAITSGKINTWDQAYSWGNHAGIYRPISYVPSWAEITSKPTTVSGFGITDAVTTARTLTISTGTGLTGGLAAQSLAANRLWTLAFDTAWGDLRYFNTNGLDQPYGNWSFGTNYWAAGQSGVTYKGLNSMFNDRFLGRKNLLYVTLNGVRNISLENSLFQGSHGANNTIASAGDPDVVFNINTVTNGLTSSNGFTYAEGFFMVHFYPGRHPQAMTARWKNRDGIWTSITPVPVLKYFAEGNYIGWKISVSGLYITDLELTLTPQAAGGQALGIAAVEYIGNRMALSEGPLLTVGGGTVYGSLTADAFVTKGGTSSQFVKADGSVDSNSYALVSSLSDYVQKSGDTMTGNLTIFGSVILDTANGPIGYKVKSGGITSDILKYGSGITSIGTAFDQTKIYSFYTPKVSLGSEQMAEYDIYHTGNFNPANYQPAGSYGLTSADITAVGLTASTLTLTRAAGNLTASVPTWNQNTTGSAATVSGQSGQLISKDDRIIEPNSITSRYLQFGFTSWNNNNTAPYADYLHLRSYQDASGGNDNLIMFRKNQLGIRIWQQAWGSATAYSIFKDVAWTDGTNASGTWAINTTGSAATLTTPRTLTIGNTGKTFNGSGNVSWSLAEIGAQAAGNYVTTDTAQTITAVKTFSVGFIDNVTNIGKASTVYTTIASGEWALPLGSSVFARVDSVGGPGTVGYWKVLGRRDTGGGYSGIYTPYDSGTNKKAYFGFSANSTNNPTWYQIWHEGSDGAGSGLDADLLDGNHASAFALASHNHSASNITSGVLSYDRLPISATDVSNWNNAFSWGNHAAVGYGMAVDSVFYVEGNTSGTAGTWTGTNAKISSYYDGLTISFKIGVAGAATTTLNLNGLGARTVRRNTGNLTTHLPVGTVVMLTYTTISSVGYWVWADYDANTTYSAMSLAEMQAGTATDSRVIRADYLNQWLDSRLNQFSMEEDVFGYTGSSVFTLSKNFATGANVYVNGKRLTKNLDWSLAANQITISDFLKTGDEIVVTYFYATPDVVPSNISGTGSASYLTKWLSSTEIGASIIQDNGSLVTINGALKATSVTNSVGDFLTITVNGDFRKRTASEVRGDIGAAAVSHTHSASEIVSGVLSYDRLPISSTDVTNWNTAYGWGNHAGLYAAASHSHNASQISAGTFGNGNFVFQNNISVGGQIHSDAHNRGNSGTGTVTFNWDESNMQTVTLTGNCTFAFSNGRSGGVYQIIITRDGTANRTITWPSTIKWSGGEAWQPGPANTIDVVTISFDGSTYFAVITYDMKNA